MSSVMAVQADGAPCDAAAATAELRAALTRGVSMHKAGRFADAAAAYEDAVRIAPRRVGLWESLVRLKFDAAKSSGRREDMDAAIAACRDACAHGADTALIDFRLASVGAAAAPGTAPRRYVEGLFDDYAPVFDAHMRDVLACRAPQAVAAMVRRHHSDTPADIVDQGCGTGLCGPLLAPLARRMTGVDLSAGMLAVARERGCYDALEHAELVDHLERHPANYGIAVAADVMCYIGDLRPVFEAARTALRSGGLIVASFERHAGDGFALGASRRYAHSDAYVWSAAGAANFEVEASMLTTLRQEAGAPVRGSLMALRRLP